MTDQELNRAVQYVTASTSYGRDTVAEILKTGLSEMTSLAMQSSERFERDVLLEYVCQWTIKRTGQPEPLVREILGCASRWLDEVYEEITKRQTEARGLSSDDDDEGAEPVLMLPPRALLPGSRGTSRESGLIQNPGTATSE